MERRRVVRKITQPPGGVKSFRNHIKSDAASHPLLLEGSFHIDELVAHVGQEKRNEHYIC